MGNIEHVYNKVAILENNGYVVGAVHLNGKPENEYAPLEWCNDEDVLDVDKFGVITVEQYEKAGYKFPAPTDERVQWFGIEDITEDDVNELVSSEHEAIEERDKVLVHALYEVEHSSDDDRLRNVMGVFLDVALGAGKYKHTK